VGGRAVGVPGAVRMLEAAHRVHGRLPWRQLFEPAIALADEGFAISPRLHAMSAHESHLKADRQAAATFYRADGEPHPVGHRLRNPALAAVLRLVAERGSTALHEGAVAADIVRRVRTHPTNPGQLDSHDLLAYRAIRREAICTDWREFFRVCGMPPPSSGHLAVMQILGLLEAAPPDGPPLSDGLPSADFLHQYTEAARLAFADRNHYVADPDFVQPPGGAWTHLLAPAYLRKRAALIGPRSMGMAQPGVPGALPVATGSAVEFPETGTSHLSIVDAHGHAVAMTTTIEGSFGARLMSDGGTGLAGGFLLNNQLTDFSFAPADAQGRPIANRVQPGKRPRSSMSPTLVFDRRDGSLVASLGSPGGAAIIHFTAKTLIATLAWTLAPQAAADLPNFGSFGGPTVLESQRFPAATVQALQARGHEVREVDLTSGVHLLLRTADGWSGGADPRREGVVVGE
jgi:gamma-glutamyltranspeptidase/glutathione hydrolase